MWGRVLFSGPHSPTTTGTRYRFGYWTTAFSYASIHPAAGS